MEENKNYTQESLTALEAVLFAAAAPVSYTRLSETMGLKAGVIHEMCQTISNNYEKRGSGIRMQFMDGQVQLTTAPEASSAVETFLGLEATQKLSRAALETLTIIAYRQPVSRPAVDSIRGVNSEYILRGLLTRGLIEEVGRAETAGRPILYGTTQDFLLYFGLSSLNDLPPFETDVVEENETELSILKE
ncbi:MAG: SMC-Scp complex subunit ScpB [Anaerolineaceae bacterium]|nr:SMC-Scp complex subunit ScpB [Anaerolineaceae bacterium]